jgi:hypothetical protein
MEFQELRSHFEIVRKRFERAETIEEKLQLLEVSKQIISAADGQEEAKGEKEVSATQQQLDTVRAATKLLGGMRSSGKTTGGKKRVMSAAGRAKVSKANKERWAKFRAAKAKVK